MKQYKSGLLIGRFQPFHLGHKYLVEKSLEVCEKIIIAVGSVNAIDENNPYSFEERKAMLEKFVDSEHLNDKIQAIIPIVDDPSDDIWFENLQSSVKSFDVVISNNDWVKGIFEGKGIPVIAFPYYKREILEGWKIRELMKKHEKWEDRVPSYIALAINPIKS